MIEKNYPKINAVEVIRGTDRERLRVRWRDRVLETTAGVC